MKKYTQTDQSQIVATNALINLIAGNLLPLFIESCFFRRFISILDSCYIVPSRQNLSAKILTEKQPNIKNRMRDLLEKVDSISITVDLWSNRLIKGFLGIVPPMALTDEQGII